MKLSVVIPAYNEEATIRDCVLDVFRAFPYAEVIVVNDKSTDNTLKILRSIQKRKKRLRILNNRRNRGHGYSVMRGLRDTIGDKVLYIDADRQIDLSNYREYLGWDFVSGYRVHRQDKLFRKFVSFGLKMTNRIRHGFKIKDANCPFKIYRGDSVRILLDLVPKTYVVPIAALEVLARQFGLRTKEIPVRHQKYFTVRKGMLQSLNRKSIKFIWDAFWEIWKT